MAKQIGALWSKTYEQGGGDRKYWSGVIDLGALGETNIAVFKNDQKEKDNHPDLRIVLSERSQKEDTGREDPTYIEPF